MTHKKPTRKYPNYLNGQECKINDEWKLVDVNARGIDKLLRGFQPKRSLEPEYANIGFTRTGFKNLEESLLVEYAESLKCRAYDLLNFVYGGDFCMHDGNYPTKAVETLYDAGLITDSNEVKY